VTSSCKEDFSVNGVDDEILNLYPNPAGEYLTIDMKLQEQAEGEALIQIINMIGQVIYTERSMLTNGTLRTVIHLDKNTHSGMYMVNVMVNDELYSRQFMH
jgi:phage terminase large subunit-like protein